MRLRWLLDVEGISDLGVRVFVVCREYGRSYAPYGRGILVRTHQLTDSPVPDCSMVLPPVPLVLVPLACQAVLASPEFLASRPRGRSPGFLSGSVFAFAPVLIAQTTLLVGMIGNSIWHAGATLPSFKMEIATAVVGFLLLLVLTPLGFFLEQSDRAGRGAIFFFFCFFFFFVFFFVFFFFFFFFSIAGHIRHSVASGLVECL